MVKRKSIFLEYTEVPAKRTVGQILELLGEIGARRVLMENGPNGRVTELSFMLTVGGRDVPFRLPVQVGPVKALLLERRRAASQVDEAAERVAWRMALKWLEVQLAYIRAGQVTPAQVFLSFAQLSDGRTVFEAMEATGFKALPEPKGDR